MCRSRKKEMKITKSVRPFLSRSLWQTASPNGNELKITMVAPEQLQAIAGVCVNDDLFIRFRTLSHNLSNYSSGKFQIRTIWHEISMQWGTPNGKKTPRGAFKSYCQCHKHNICCATEWLLLRFFVHHFCSVLSLTQYRKRHRTRGFNFFYSHNFH